MNTPHPPITTEAALVKALKIDSLDDIRDNADAQRRALGIAKSLTRSDLIRLLGNVPALQSVFSDMICSVSLASISKDETKRIRWRVLQGIAEAGALTGPEILEAFRILGQIEREERSDAIGMLQTIVVGLGALAVFAFFLVTGIDIGDDV